MSYTGSCLCGGVRFRIEGELEPIQICHCRQCQKAQGGAFAAVTPVATSRFRFIDGDDLLTAYASSPGKERVFCRRCGSPIFSRRASLPDVVRVRVGLIEEPIPVGIAWHAHTGSRSSWWPLEDDGSPRYTHGRPASTERKRSAT